MSGTRQRNLLKVDDIKQVLSSAQQTQELIYPRYTTTARNALTADTGRFTGMQIYNTTTNKYNFWNGTAWEVITSA